MIHKSKKLNRKERIEYLKEVLNVISNLRFNAFSGENKKDPRDIRFISSEKKPIYSWWKIFWDIVIGLNIRK